MNFVNDKFSAETLFGFNLKSHDQAGCFNLSIGKLTLKTGDDVLSKSERSVAKLSWDKALWLAVPSPISIFNQSECFISA